MRKIPAIMLASFVLIGMSVASLNVVHATTPVTLTKHADLGFTSSIPLNLQTGDVCDFSLGGCVFSHNLGFVGSADIKVDLGADIAMSYDASQLVPGGSMPVTVTYTPTPGGSTAEFDISGTATIDFTGCTDCPFVTPFTVASGGAVFTAPMGADSPITIPGSGSSLNLGDVISASVGSSITLAPAPAGSPSGLGGAAALVSVSGATTSQLLPIEWDSSGASQTFTLSLPANLGPIGVSLGPLVHWLDTSGSAEVDLHWGSVADGVYAALVTAACNLIPFPGNIACLASVSFTPSDPSPIGIYSGNLGQFYTSVGLDTTIGNTVANAVGPPFGTIIGNDIANNIGNGIIPIPLLSPSLASFPPFSASLGTVDFAIPVAGITGAPSNAVLLGNSVTLTASTAGGTGPFTYAWTANGAPIGGSTPSLTDTPALGTTSYGLTVTDSQGAVSNTVTADVNVYDFALSVSPTSLQVLTSGSNSYSPGVTESLVTGSSSVGLPSIGLAVTGGLPSGATPSFAPAGGGAAGFTSVLTVTTAGAAAGTYTLTITGTDATPFTGGTRTTTVSLTILTPAQALPNVINTINGLKGSGVLNAGQANSLITKLNHAIGNLNSTPPKPNTACNQLTSFVNEVNSLVADGVLTQAQADTLLQGPLGVLAIMASIPC